MIFWVRLKTIKYLFFGLRQLIRFCEQHSSIGESLCIHCRQMCMRRQNVWLISCTRQMMHPDLAALPANTILQWLCESTFTAKQRRGNRFREAMFHFYCLCQILNIPFFSLSKRWREKERETLCGLSQRENWREGGGEEGRDSEKERLFYSVWPRDLLIQAILSHIPPT